MFEMLFIHLCVSYRQYDIYEFTQNSTIVASQYELTEFCANVESEHRQNLG